MANENDIVSRLILDDSDFIKKIEGVNPYIDKLAANFDSLQKDVKDASKVIGNDLVDGNEKANKSLKDTEKQMAANYVATNKLVSSIKLFGIDLGSLRQKLVEYKENLIGVSKEIKIFGTLSGTQKRGIVELTNALGGGRGAFIAVAKAANVFKLALISTGIGALVVALGALIAYFTRTQSGIDKVSQKMAGIRVAISVLVDAFSSMGEIIVKAFDNPKKAVVDLYNVIKENLINRLAAVPIFFVALGKTIGNSLILKFDEAGEAAKEAGRAVVQFTTGLDSEQQKAFGDQLAATALQMKNAAIAAANLEARKQKLRDATRDLGIEESKYRAEIAKNKLISEDTTKDYKTRIDAARIALGLEQNLLSKKIKLAQEEVNIIRSSQKLTKNLTADNDELATAQIKVSQLKAESTEKQIELTNKLNGLEKESRDKLIQLSKEIVELGVQFGILNKKEEFDFIKKDQIKNFGLLKDELIKIKSIATGDELELINKQLKILDDVTESLSKREFIEILSFDTTENDKFNIDRLIENVNKRRTIQLQDIESSLFSDETKEALKTEILLRGELERLEILQEYGDKNSLVYEQNALRILEIQNKLAFKVPAIDAENFWDSIDTFEDLLNESLEKLFGDEGAEKAKEFLSGLGSLVGEFGNILNEANDLQIKAIDKQLDALSERREKAQDDLDKELELQKEGLANNVGNKQGEVDGLLAEEERLTKEREKIQREAERRQLIADTVQQAQSLITSSINIIKGFSTIPFIGLPLGIAAVATLVGFFAKTKAQAFAATKLHTGAERIDDHFGEVGHRSDIPGRGEGYRVVDAVTGQDTNVRISGKEMLLPENITQSQRRFFKNLKAGKYNFDIADVLDLHTSLRESVSGGVVQQTIINNTSLPSKQWVSYTTKKGVNKAILLDLPKKGEIGSTYIFQD